MGKNVFRRPARDIEPDPVGKEAETGRRQGVAALAHQHRVELVPQRMQMENVAGRIGHLRIREIGSAPVGQLLLLGEIDADELARQILETADWDMPVAAAIDRVDQCVSAPGPRSSPLRCGRCIPSRPKR